MEEDPGGQASGPISPEGRLRIHAYSALDIAVGVLSEFKMFEGKLYSPSQGWETPWFTLVFRLSRRA